MKLTIPPTIVPVALLLVSSSLIHAQNIDWGSWSATGSASYVNGDTIAISGLVNGSTVAVFNETASPHSISDPAFPYLNAPATGEFGFFRNQYATTSEWSVKIDLSDFSLSASSVIGFSNLDGRDLNSLTPTQASIVFLDALNAPVSVSSATFVGAFDNNWSGLIWDADSRFDLSTGIWDVVPGSGVNYPQGSYADAVGNAFFLTNLSSDIKSIVYTKSGLTDYAYDSTLFYAGNVAVPEPSSALLISIAGTLCFMRRRRN
jgi:hypothetical protein